MKNTIYQMIKLTSIAFMFMAISSQTILAQWVAQTSGITGQLNSAFFIDSFSENFLYFLSVSSACLDDCGES